MLKKKKLQFAVYVSASLGATIESTKSLSSLASGIFRAVYYGA